MQHTKHQKQRPPMSKQKTNSIPSHQYQQRRGRSRSFDNRISDKRVFLPWKTTTSTTKPNSRRISKSTSAGVSLSRHHVEYKTSPIDKEPLGCVGDTRRHRPAVRHMPPDNTPVDLTWIIYPSPDPSCFSLEQRVVDAIFGRLKIWGAYDNDRNSALGIAQMHGYRVYERCVSDAWFGHFFAF